MASVIGNASSVTLNGDDTSSASNGMRLMIDSLAALSANAYEPQTPTVVSVEVTST